MRDIPQDELYLACTRPAMKWGVPLEGWVINVGLTWIIGMVAGNPFIWLVFLPIHAVMRGHADKNPNFYRELLLFFDTKGRNISGTFAALPVRLRRREVASNV